MPTTTSLPDTELMRRVQADDATAFGLLYDRTKHRAHALAMAMTRNQRQAEDVVQEAYLDLWRSRAAYRPARAAVATWLLAIVRNRALDALRRSVGRERPWVDIAGYEAEDHGLEALDDQAIRREAGRTVRACLARLPAEQTVALGLAYFGGLTQSEIARRLDVPLGTVKSRIRLGHERLAGELERTAGASALLLAS